MQRLFCVCLNIVTHTLCNGADLRHIQMLGHTSILITQLYTHVSRKELSEVYEATHPSAEGGSGLL
ncbi:integrase [Pseudoalteromonas sp. US3C1013]|uniref:integrase n=1 Tax=unclassified Pseudoalteromonas TaxID=194690 RepID=UPI003AB4DC45